MPLVLLALAGALALGVSAAPVHGDLTRDAVDAANATFVKLFRAGDARGVSELYTEDAQVVAPGAEVARGRAAIAAYWAGGMKTTRGVRLETAHVESSGDLAFEDGVVHLEGSDGTKSSARYVVVWKRSGGRWLMHRDVWNTAAP
jgi:uncharacterized protein (TIGR02246 family)